MKGFFFFVVINVFVWKIVVCAREDKLETPNNIYELNMLVGEYKFLEEYKGKMLIISNLFTNLEFNAHNTMLMDLSMKYHQFGLRVLAIFNNQLNNIETEDEPKIKMIDSMNKSKIEFVFVYEEMHFWNTMKFSYEDYSYIFDYHTFFVDRNGIAVHGFIQTENSFEEINESILISEMKPWNHTKSVYKLVVRNYDGVSVSMEEYINKVLIVSFICEATDQKESKKFHSLLDKAKNYYTDHLRILIFLGTYTKEQKKNQEKYIKKSITELKVRVFRDNKDADILKEFCRLKIKEIDDSVNTKYINEFIINQEGKVVGEFKGDMEKIDEILKKLYIEEHVVKTDQIVS